MKLSEEFLRIARKRRGVGYAIACSTSDEAFDFAKHLQNDGFAYMSDDHARLFCCLMAEIAKEEE